jgi:hypothetical protein
MSDAKIVVRRRMRFSVVADQILEARSLTFTARIVLAWALGRQDGFECWVWYMCKELGLTDKTWTSARKELVNAGYFKQTRERGPGGKFIWRNEFTDAPLYQRETGGGSNPAPAQVKTKRSAKPSGPDKQQEEQLEGVPTWLFGILRIAPDNAADAMNARAIAAYPRDRIETAAASARSKEPSGIAYPTTVIKLLRADGYQPPPQPPRLSEWALAAEAARHTPPKGMTQKSES